MSQKEPDVQLSSKQAQFVEALLAGSTLEEAATAAHISYSTAKRWQHVEAVKEALKAGQQVLFEAALERLKRLMPKALEAIEKHLDAPVMVTAATQITSARLLIEQNIELNKIDDLQREIAEMKDILKARNI